MKHFSRLRMLPGAVAAFGAALLASCSPPVPLKEAAPQPQVPVESRTSAETQAPGTTTYVSSRSSNAATARAYRTDAASHLYANNAERIYKGRLPPMLYAIGVLQVEVDNRGAVRKLDWMRAPKHAPEVIAEIERTVRAAAPFPVPARMGKVVYTDTWLWHKSGRFQLDTLTEGQD
jgi:periplasmic protein TonB